MHPASFAGIGSHQGPVTAERRAHSKRVVRRTGALALVATCARLRHQPYGEDNGSLLELSESDHRHPGRHRSFDDRLQAGSQPEAAADLAVAVRPGATA